jgi:parallel beta-helix repeat protein
MIYNVQDFGAKGDGITDDTAAIQAAVDAAHAAGGGSVYLPTGIYIVHGGATATDGCIRIYDNTTVYGDGMGLSTIKLADHWNKDVTGILRDPVKIGCHDITAHDLSIDGNRANNTGKVDGWFNGTLPGSTKSDLNITLDHVEVKNCGGYGFDPHEQTTNLTITNCVSHGNGLDGFTLDFQIGAHIDNNVAYGNDRHGFNICTSSHDVELTNNTAYGNGAQGVMIQRGSEDITLVHDVQIHGGSYYNNKGDGIQVNMADHILIDGADIHHNGQRGIRIRGSDGSTIENCFIHDNSTSKTGGYEEIRLESVNDSVSGHLLKTLHTLIENNIIRDTGSPDSSYGIREIADGTDYTVVSGNSIYGTLHDQPTLTGPHSYAATSGTSGDDVYSGGSGTDVYFGNDGNDTVHGNGGNDTIHGGTGNDSLYGDAGDDLLYGEDGNDYFNGGNGNDTLDGGTGDDKMLGSAGDDILTGGAGRDTFQFSTGIGHDTVLDFTHGDDVLNISKLLSANFADFQQHVTQNGSNTVITFGADTIQLTGFTDPLQVTDVHFY